MAEFDEQKDALATYEAAYRTVRKIRQDMARKPGYVREKSPDEMAYQAAKKAFGEFVFDGDKPDLAVMEGNTNNDQGVTITLSNGQEEHLPNQRVLFEKIVAFNKEAGGFWDKDYMRAQSPEDLDRMEFTDRELAGALKAVLKTDPSRENGFRLVKAIERRIQGEMDAQRAEHSESRETPQAHRAAPDKNVQKSTDSPANATPPNIIFLSVPYAEKDAAKALGARWHGEKQRWFAPEDADLSLFELWRIAKDTQHTTTNDKGEKPTLNTLGKIDPIPKPETAPIPESKNAPSTGVKTAPEPSPAPTPESTQESAPTIPEALNRYYRILGDTKKAQYFFQGQPDVEAFRGKGRKMITKHDGPKIAQSMVELAEAKGWSNLKVSGSEQFRRSVWLAAQERDMTVTGYTPTTQDLENAKFKKNTTESENSPTQAPDTQPEPEEAKAADAQEAPLEAPPAARSEPPGTHPESTEPPPGVGTTSDFTEPASEQTHEHEDYASAVADKRKEKQAAVATALYNSPGEKAARRRQPEHEQEFEDAEVTRAADIRVSRQESVKAELDTTPINYGLKATLRAAYLTRDKKEAIAEFPQLKPVYAFEQSGKKFVARIRENALDVLARGKTLPARLPSLSMPPKVPKNERSNDMELER